MTQDPNAPSCAECQPWNDEVRSLRSLYAMQNLTGGDHSALAQLRRRVDVVDRKLGEHFCTGDQFQTPGTALG